MEYEFTSTLIKDRDCVRDGHTTVGIPIKSCVVCGKRWLTGDDTTDANELESYDVVNNHPEDTTGFYTIFDCRAINVVYKIPRK